MPTDLALRLTGDDVSASRAIEAVGRAAEEAQERLDRLGLAHIDTAGLDELRRELDEVARDRQVNVRVDLDTAGLEQLRAELGLLNGRSSARVEVELDPPGIATELELLRGDISWFDGHRASARLSLTGLTTAARQIADLNWAIQNIQYGHDWPLRLEIDVDIDSIAEVELLHDLLDRVDRTYTARINVEESGGGSLREAGNDASRLDGIFGGLRDRAKGAATGLLGVATTAATLAAKVVVAGEVVSKAATFIGQVGPAAAVAAPAILTMAEGMGVLKLASDGVSKQFQVLTPQMDRLKAVAAASIHGGISDLIAGIKTDLPVVTEGIRSMGTALGGVASEAGALISQPFFRGDLKTIMDGNAKAVGNLGDAGLNVADAFIEIAAAAEPVWVGLTRILSAGAQNLSQWIDMKAASGELAATISKSAESFGTFISALGLFGSGAHAIFSALHTDSGDLATSIYNVAYAFNSWATSDAVIARIKADVAGIKTVVDEAVYALRQGFFNPGVDEAAGWPGLVQHFGQTLRELTDFVTQQVVPTLGSLAALLTGPFGTALLSVLDIVHQLVLSGLTTLLQIIRDDLVPLLRDNVAPLLNDVIIPAFRGLSDWCEQHLFPAVKQVADTLRDQFGPALDHIRQTIEDNKPQLDIFVTGLKELGTVLIDLATSAIGLYLIASLKAMVLEITAVITIISALMEAAARLAVIMLQAFATIIDGFRAIFDAAASAVAGTLRVWATLLGPLGEPFRRAASDVDAFKGNVDRDMSAAAGAARDTAGSINGWLDSIHDKTVTVTIQQRVEFDAAFASVEGLAQGGRASGGPVKAGTTYWVGEQGRELFTPNVSGAITDAATSKAMTSHQNDVYDGSLARVSRAAGGGWDGAAAPAGNVYNITVSAGVIATPSERRKLADAIVNEITDAQVNRRGSNARVTR